MPGDLDAQCLVQHRHRDQHGEDQLTVPQRPLHAQIVPVAAAELLLVADLLYGVRLDLEGLDVGALGPGHLPGLLADRRDDPVPYRRLGEAAGVQRAALQQGELVVDRAYHVPAAERVDLPGRVGGHQVLGELPGTPAGAHAEYALGAGVEDRVRLLFGGEPGQRLAQFLGRRLVGAARHGFGDLGADAGAREQAAPAGPQIPGRALADLLGPEPAEHGQHDARPGVPRPETAERHLEQEQRGEHADTEEQHGGERPGPPVVTLGDERAQLEDDQPGDQPGQEEHSAQDRHRGQPVVALPADVVRREAVLDHELRLGAEGLDERFAAGSEHAGDHGPRESLSQIGPQQRDLAGRDGRLMPFVVGLLDLLDRAVPVRRGSQRGGRRLPLVARDGHLGPVPLRSQRHSRPHRRRPCFCGLPDFPGPHTC